ncbi:MAG: cell division protein FtsL [Betaproteobacteria bacterium]|nr:cell division protein FtsL [Betaproteobacteria bacterium]
MAKLNLLLLAVLVACALGLVTSQNKARQLFSAVEQAQEHARRLDVEYGQLQLEAATWGQHARVRKIAHEVLGMHAPDPSEVRIIMPAGGAAR